MNSNGYVGRFGDTLRKLTALDAGQGAFSPQKVGGADTAGAFSVAAPQAGAAPQMAQAPMGAPPPDAAGSGFGGAPAAPATDGFGQGAAIDESGAMGGATPGDSPTSWNDLMDQMPDDQKHAMADHIESKVGDLAETYRATALQHGVQPKKHASRMHMAMFLGEIALRAAANRGTSQSDAEALAKGVLQTQDRRTAVSEADRAKQEKDAETRRVEGRQDTIRQEGYDQGDRTHARDRGEVLADDKRNHEQALELERMRLAAQKAERAGQNVRIVVDADGNYQLIDLDTKQAIPVEQDVTEVTPPTKGSRGQGNNGTTKKVKKPVKALPKSKVSELDPDTVLNKIAATVKELRGDTKLRRSLKAKGMDESQINQEIERMAREQVQGDVESLSGTPRAATPAARRPNNVFDQFDEPK